MRMSFCCVSKRVTCDAVTLEELELINKHYCLWLTPVTQVLQHVPAVHVPAAWVKHV